MIEILMRCALESDFGVIIRAILPVVESWSWTEACSVAQSEEKKNVVMHVGHVPISVLISSYI